jgi:hypothetical protein
MDRCDGGMGVASAFISPCRNRNVEKPKWREQYFLASWVGRVLLGFRPGLVHCCHSLPLRTAQGVVRASGSENGPGLFGKLKACWCYSTVLCVDVAQPA